MRNLRSLRDARRVQDDPLHDEFRQCAEKRVVGPPEARTQVCVLRSGRTSARMVRAGVGRLAPPSAVPSWACPAPTRTTVARTEHSEKRPPNTDFRWGGAR